MKEWVVQVTGRLANGMKTTCQVTTKAESRQMAILQVSGIKPAALSGWVGIGSSHLIEDICAYEVIK